MLQNDVVDFLMETVMSSDNAGDSTELTSVREILEAIGKILEKNDYYPKLYYFCMTKYSDTYIRQQPSET